MKGRERVIRAIEFEGPDRIPIMHSVLPGAMDRHGKRLEELFLRYPSDFASEPGHYAYSADSPQHRKGTYRDEWECVWINPMGGIEGQVKVHPLADWKALETYEFPDPYTGDWDQLEELVRANRGEKFILVSGGGGRLFERMHFLRGYENLMLDIAEGREEVGILRDKVLEHTMRKLERQLGYDIDGVSFMDDWGTQGQLMINPKQWRRLFKSAYRKIIELVHQAGKFFYFHCDGNIMEIIPDLIEIGVDVLNPQFSCMDLDEVGQKCGGRVCISSDIDRQYILPRGSVEEVKRYVKRVIEIFGSHNGGLIGRGEIGPDVPLANVEAMFKAFSEWGSH